jgi:hypothetical protein
MTDLIERLRLGDGTSPDHLLLLEAADALEKSVECMCGICKLGPPQREWVGLTDEAQLELNAAIVQTLLPKLYSIIDRLLDGQDKALVIEARRVLPKAYKNSFEKGKGV